MRVSSVEWTVSLSLSLAIGLVPEELVDKMKQGNIGRDFKIEQKMSLREKQKAKRKAEDEEERAFFDQTGIKDLSKDFTMDNLIKKYEHDMQRHEKRFAKMKQLESEGKHYDMEGIALSDDEKGDYIERLAEARLREKKDYDDEPYKVAQDEEQAVEKQYEEIKSKIEALKGKVEDGEKLKPEDQLYKEYEGILNSMENYHDLGFRLDHKIEMEQL